MEMDEAEVVEMLEEVRRRIRLAEKDDKVLRVDELGVEVPVREERVVQHAGDARRVRETYGWKLDFAIRWSEC